MTDKQTLASLSQELSWSHTDSYRVEKKAKMQVALGDADAEIAPVPVRLGLLPVFSADNRS